jgi:hypothetical protein
MATNFLLFVVGGRLAPLVWILQLVLCAAMSADVGNFPQQTTQMWTELLIEIFEVVIIEAAAE